MCIKWRKKSEYGLKGSRVGIIISLGIGIGNSWVTITTEDIILDSALSLFGKSEFFKHHKFSDIFFAIDNLRAIVAVYTMVLGNIFFEFLFLVVVSKLVSDVDWWLGVD